MGALGECAAQDADNRVSMRKAGGLVQLLTGTPPHQHHYGSREDVLWTIKESMT